MLSMLFRCCSGIISFFANKQNSTAEGKYGLSSSLLPPCRSLLSSSWVTLPSVRSPCSPVPMTSNRDRVSRSNQAGPGKGGNALSMLSRPSCPLNPALPEE